LIKSIAITGFLIFSILSTSATVSAQFAFLQLSTPFCTKLGIFWALGVSGLSTQQGSNEAVVIAVLHDSIGQTVDVTTSTATFNQGENQTLYFVINLPFGTYYVGVFPFTTSGQPVSPIYTIAC
jgi:hypothetical protein